jgi:hypothetical protein
MQSFTVSKCKLAPVIISGHLYIFQALVYFLSAFIIFQSAFIQIFFLPKHCLALALISGCKAHNFLIMLLIIF